jgi:hypothetical protein
MADNLDQLIARGPGQVDFSPLGDLFKDYQAAKIQAARSSLADAVGAGGVNGPDYDSAALHLLKAGDIQGASALANLAGAAQTRKLQLAQFNRPSFVPNIGNNAYGLPTPGFVNPNTQTGTPLNGGGGGGTGSPMNLSGIDPNKRGFDYLSQFPDEVQGAVRAYMAGGVLPSGNPRNNGIAAYAKQIAQKVANDVGNPDLADDTLYAERRRMRTDLGASGASSIGGIISNGKSAFEHLGTYSDALANIGNASYDFPGGSTIAAIQNYATNGPLASSATKAKITAANDAAQKYGAESTKFYAGTGGGEGERLMALKTNDPTKSSGEEMASYLETEKQLMLGRLQQKEAQISSTLGPDFLARHPVMTPDLQATISKIDANIARLRGQAPPSGAGGAPAGGTAPANATPAPLPKITTKAQVQDALDQARAAIAAGKDRGAVIQRLRQLGIEANP